MKIIEFIENDVVNTNGPMIGEQIKLADWEKDILEELGDSFFGKGKRDIKRIIIVGERKKGITTFCKWLHWLKPGGNGTYIISHNKEYSTMIKRRPIRLNCGICEAGEDLGIQWMKPVTIHYVKEHGLEPIKENKYIKILDEDPELHVMLDLVKFDKETIELIDAQHPDFVTISISSNRILEDRELLKWLLEQKSREDTLVKTINDNRNWMNYYE